MAAAAELARVVITGEQMEGLVRFLEQNPALARGKTKPLHLAQKLWTQCAKQLNSYQNGAKKNGKQWAKSWTDIKYRVRRRALELQAAKSAGEPFPLLPLSSTEERILAVIGKDFMEDVIVKCDPTTATWEANSLNDTNVSKDAVFHHNDTQGEFIRQPSPTLAPRTKSKTKQKTKAPFRKRKSSPGASEDVTSPSARKLRLNSSRDVDTDSGSEDSISVFLEIEKRKIESSERIADAVCSIRDQMTQLTEVLEGLKDAILNRRSC